MGLSALTPDAQCCSACVANVDCEVAVLCGDACFLKRGRTSADRKSSDRCDALSVRAGIARVPKPARPRSDKHPWLPPVTSDEFVAAVPKGTGDQVGAWQFFKRRLFHNLAATEWAVASVPPTGRALSILVVDSATVVYKMNWLSGEHLQWGDVVYGLVKAGHRVEMAATVDWSRWAREAADYDLILTDYGSMQHAASSVARLRCKLRIFDTFGTSPQYNDPTTKLPSTAPSLGIRMDQVCCGILAAVSRMLTVNTNLVVSGLARSTFPITQVSQRARPLLDSQSLRLTVRKTHRLRKWPRRNGGRRFCGANTRPTWRCLSTELGWKSYAR